MLTLTLNTCCAMNTPLFLRSGGDDHLSLYNRDDDFFIGLSARAALLGSVTARTRAGLSFFFLCSSCYAGVASEQVGWVTHARSREPSLRGVRVGLARSLRQAAGRSHLRTWRWDLRFVHLLVCPVEVVRRCMYMWVRTVCGTILMDWTWTSLGRGMLKTRTPPRLAHAATFSNKEATRV